MNFKKIFPYIMVLISVLGLLFGNNIVAEFSKPELIMDSTFLEAPKNINATSNNNAIKFPKYVRVINLRNSGYVSSENLNLTFELDGDIYELDLSSKEKIGNLETIDNNRVKLFLPRLAKGANVQLTAWINNNNNKFKVMYADNKGSGEIFKIDDKDFFPLIRIIMVLILFISLTYLAFQKYEKLNNDRIHLNNKLLQRFIELIDEFEELDKKDTIQEENNLEEDSEIIRKRIEDFVSKEE